jgi:hypothetical protein
MKYSVLQRKSTPNQKTYALSLFKNTTSRIPHMLSNKSHTVRFNQSMGFKSFFVFLKAKPCIIKSRYNLLKTLHLNPKPHTLSTFIQLTKRFTPQSLNNTLTLNHTNSFISKKKLKIFLFLTKSKSKKKLFFNLFRHKMFFYTTPKKVAFFQHSTYSHFSNIDFRTMLTLTTHFQEFPNVGNISTYN